MKRACLALSALLLLAVPAAAQPPGAGQALTIAAAVQRGYNGVKMNLTQMVDKVSEADYGFKLGTQTETRTFGQLFAHIAQAQFGTCSAVKKVPNPMMGRQLETELKTKAEFVKALNDSFAFCDDVQLADGSERDRNDPAGSGPDRPCGGTREQRRAR